MEQVIVDFHQDEAGEWVADLSCGHRQHVRHQPPFRLRPWVTTEEGRAGRVGTPIECPLCDQPDEGEPDPAIAPQRLGPNAPIAADEGGDPACWAGLLCPECGAVLDGGAHKPGCGATADDSDHYRARYR